ncbi:MAG: hypothetical protein RL701_4858, partial [Pseudomonadota bacterium]
PSARADLGVGDERVSLPDGPGSIGGIGENASIGGNMGAMRLQSRFRVPGGFQGLTPDLTVDYSSANGASVVGIGWSFETPTIERMTVRGLPRYTAEDDFAANGSEELVRVSGGDDAVYRARYEGSFVRYTWHKVGDGKDGYWTAELPDVSHYSARLWSVAA